jgi:putative tryptophan/tyrosine transport system substrate-binding protein
MRRRALLAALGVFALAPLRAQEAGTVRRIGYHSMGSSQSNAGWLDGFRAGMKDLGWIDGRHYVIDARYANGNVQAGARIAQELVASRPDVLLAPGDASVARLLERTKTIPIVFTTVADPIGGGFAANLRRPGGNVTGVMGFGRDLAAKRLDLLREVVPTMQRVAVLFEPGDPNSAPQAREIERSAGDLKIKVLLLPIRQPADIADAIVRARSETAHGVVVASGFLTNLHRHAIGSQLTSEKLPSMLAYADAGGLLSYAPVTPENFRRAATHVDKLLKGASAAELPIEQPVKIVLVVNMITAKAIGVMVPQSIMLRADRVIDG